MLGKFQKQSKEFPMRINITGGTFSCPAGMYDIWVKRYDYEEWDYNESLHAQVVTVHQSESDKIKEGIYVNIPHNSMSDFSDIKFTVDEMEMTLEENLKCCKKHTRILEEREQAECIIHTDEGEYGLQDGVPTDIHLAKIWLIDNKPEEVIGALLYKQCPGGDFTAGCIKEYLERTLNGGQPLTEPIFNQYLQDEKRREFNGLKNRCREAFQSGNKTAYSLVGYVLKQGKRNLSEVFLPAKAYSDGSKALANQWLSYISQIEMSLNINNKFARITDYISKKDIEINEKLVNLYPSEIGNQIYNYLNDLDRIDKIEQRVWEIINDEDEVFCQASYYENLVDKYEYTDICEQKKDEFFNCDLIYMCAIADVLGIERPQDASDDMFMDSNFSKYLIDAQVSMDRE